MTKPEKMNRLVVVCDGAKAVLLADAGIAPAPRLSVMESFSEPHPGTAEMGTDRPGRVHQSATAARSAVETTDFHAEAEAAFVARVARRLDALAASGEAPTRILLVAPPKALGVLREALTARVKPLVEGEIAKDLVKLPVDEIASRIAS